MFLKFTTVRGDKIDGMENGEASLKKKNKKERDFLNGSLWNKIIMFALPLAATGILQQLFNVADLAVVGRFTGDIGTTAQAAVGADSSIVGLAVSLFGGLSLGTSVVIAKAIGNGNRQRIENAVHTSVLFSLICGVVFAGLGEALAAPVLSALNIETDVYDMALTYLRIYFAGLPVIVLYNFEAAIYRAVGNTKLPLIVLATSGVLNVGMNFLFVVSLGMNVDGVAIATVLSNLVCAIALFVCLLKTRSPIKASFKKLKISKPELIRILKIGIPAGIQSAIFSFANIIIQSAIDSLGKITMAASSAAYNIEMFVYYPLTAFSQACTTFVGQNYGAGKFERCKKVLGLCLLECSVCLGVMVAALLPLGRYILWLFNSDAQVIEIGMTRLEYICFAYIFTTIYENIAGYLRGYGISLLPAILTVVGVCGVRMIWIFGVFPHYNTFANIMTAYPVSLAVTALFMLVALIVSRPSEKFSRKADVDASGV